MCGVIYVIRVIRWNNLRNFGVLHATLWNHMSVTKHIANRSVNDFSTRFVWLWSKLFSLVVYSKVVLLIPVLLQKEMEDN